MSINHRKTSIINCYLKIRAMLIRRCLSTLKFRVIPIPAERAIEVVTRSSDVDFLVISLSSSLIIRVQQRQEEEIMSLG